MPTNTTNVIAIKRRLFNFLIKIHPIQDSSATQVQELVNYMCDMKVRVGRMMWQLLEYIAFVLCLEEFKIVAFMELSM